jgi:hypothetical protein
VKNLARFVQEYSSTNPASRSPQAEARSPHSRSPRS